MAMKLFYFGSEPQLNIFHCDAVHLERTLKLLQTFSIIIFKS